MGSSIPQGALGDTRLQDIHEETCLPRYSLGLCSPSTQLLPQHFLMAAAPHFGFDGAYFVKKIILTQDS